MLDGSIELEKEKNDFLTGVAAIVEAISAGKILCRVYRKDKFHAKAYITHARQEVTIRIMQEIDEVIEKHGGWPDAFVVDKVATGG